MTRTNTDRSPTAPSQRSTADPAAAPQHPFARTAPTPPPYDPYQPNPPAANAPAGYDPNSNTNSAPDPRHTPDAAGAPAAAPASDFPDLPDHLIASRSTLFHKLPPETLRDLNRAIILRDPPTYAAIFDHFRLMELDISFTAFYYYARRLRRVASEHLPASHFGSAQPSGARPADFRSTLLNLLSTRLLEALVDEESKPNTIRSLTEAWRMAAAFDHNASRQVGQDLITRIHTESVELNNSRKAMQSLVEALQSEHDLSNTTRESATTP